MSWESRERAIQALIDDSEWMAGRPTWERAIGAALIVDKGKRTPVFRTVRQPKLTPKCMPAVELLEEMRKESP
jgi:hypothetical protein